MSTEEIKLTIRNPNTETYKSIDLRKFFYMVFIQDDGKTLDLYIATVFGGNTQKAKNQNDASTNVKYISEVECSLQFVFSGIGSFKVVKSENLTGSFCGQPQWVEKVWGKCKVLSDQTALKSELCSLYKNLYTTGTSSNISNIDAAKYKFYSFSQHNKLTPFVVASAVSADDGFIYETGKDYYILSSPKNCPFGLETIHWIKTTIQLNDNFLKKQAKSESQNKRITFEVEFEGTYFSPDFTWYFSPPRGYVVSQDSIVWFDNKEEKNSLQSVSDDTTVEFKEWVNLPESINERKKTRIRFPDRSDIEKQLEQKPIKVSLRLENPHKHDNLQFFFGLLVAFFLAFFSDKTRIDYIYDCVRTKCECADKCMCQPMYDALTIAIPILLILVFSAIVMHPGRALPHRDEKCWINTFWKIVFTLGILVVVCLILYVYIFWLLFPGFMTNSIMINCFINKRILFWGVITGFISNGLYLGYCILHLKRKISNYL